METLANLVKDGQGSPIAGRQLFHEKASCGKCHRLFEQGGDIGPDLTVATVTVAESLPDDPAELRKWHIELFPPIASQDAPAYETGYRGDGIFQQSAIMADIAGFYRAFGYEPVCQEPPDHFANLFGFLALLAVKQAYATHQGDGEQVEVARDAETLFQVEHLNPYFARFAERLALMAPPDGALAPVAAYAHPGVEDAGLPQVGISVTGGHVYRGSAIPELVGKYVFGDWSRSFSEPDGTLLGLEETAPGVFELSVLDIAGGIFDSIDFDL